MYVRQSVYSAQRAGGTGLKGNLAETFDPAQAVLPVACYRRAALLFCWGFGQYIKAARTGLGSSLRVDQQLRFLLYRYALACSFTGGVAPSIEATSISVDGSDDQWLKTCLPNK